VHPARLTCRVGHSTLTLCHVQSLMPSIFHQSLTLPISSFYTVANFPLSSNPLLYTFPFPQFHPYSQTILKLHSYNPRALLLSSKMTCMLVRMHYVNFFYMYFLLFAWRNKCLFIYYLFITSCYVTKRI